MGEGTAAVVLEGEKRAEESSPAAGVVDKAAVSATSPTQEATAPQPLANGEHKSKDKAGPEAQPPAERAPPSEPPTPSAEPAVAASRKRKAEQQEGDAPPAGETKPAAAAAPTAAAAGLVRGLKIEDLARAVRTRMDEVLREGADDGMRKDARLINFLGEVEEAQALAALNEYHAAISETTVNIRNKPAYLMGILRKYKQGQRAPVGNGAAGGMVASPNAMGRMGAGPDGLSPAIAGRLEKLYESGFVKKSDVDHRCLAFFRDLTEAEASAAMDEFGQSDITSVRNKSAFLMSILRRHHQGSNALAGSGFAAAEAGARPGAAAAAAAAAAGRGMGAYGGHSFVGMPHLSPFRFMDPSATSMHVSLAQSPASFADLYGMAAAYGHPHHATPALFNAYGQPVAATLIPQHMPMFQSGSTEMLPASIQLRIDQMAATGFCHPAEIDDRCRKFLREVPEYIALQAMDELTATDRKHIRKVSAYFMGVIRKHAENYREMLAIGATGGAPSGAPSPYEAGMKRIREYQDYWGKNQRPKPPTPGGALMERIAGAPLKVQAGISSLIEKGIAVEWDIDVRVTNAFLELPEEQAVEAIEEFASCDMSRIRNKSAYLMGLLKRYKSGAPPPPGLAHR